MTTSMYRPKSKNIKIINYNMTRIKTILLSQNICKAVCVSFKKYYFHATKVRSWC